MEEEEKEKGKITKSLTKGVSNLIRIPGNLPNAKSGKRKDLVG
jgi:hypothetical protein